MDGDGAVDLPAAPEQAPEGELDLGGVPIRLRHAREDLGGVVEAVVDQVIKTLEVVARQAHGTCGAVLSAEEKLGRQAHPHDGQPEKHRRQFEHAPETSRLRGKADNPAASKGCRAA